MIHLLQDNSNTSQRYLSSDGRVLPGVTTVVAQLARPKLVAWAHREGLRGRDITQSFTSASDIGSICHALIASDGDYELENRYHAKDVACARSAFQRWKHYAAEQQLSMISRWCERPLIHHILHFGGTPDIVCSDSSQRIILIDVKTTARIREEHRIQVAAYRALLLLHGIYIDEVRIVRVGRRKTDLIEVTSVAHLHERWRLFQKLLEIYYLRQRIERDTHV